MPTIFNPTTSLAVPGRRRRSACRTSSSTGSGSRRSCFPSTRPPGIEYGVRWEVLAAINEIETDYGRNLNVSTAGALGWMQFMPATWRSYGVDANGDGEGPLQPGRRDLRRRALPAAAGAEEDLRKRDLRLQPRRLVRRQRPHARAPHRRAAVGPRRLADRPDPGPLPGRRAAPATPTTHAPRPSAGSRGRNAARAGRGRRQAGAASTSTPAGAPVVAVQDGTIVAAATTSALGRFVMLRDAYGNTYTYAHLGVAGRAHPAPKRRAPERAAFASRRRPGPQQAASAGARRQEP